MIGKMSATMVIPHHERQANARQSLVATRGPSGARLEASSLVFAFQAIGVSWSSIQWLAAAITVGLGFGLQEIFANFVSRLILLFERPIRLGDTVTVGDVEGTVSRIQIRATTVTDWNRKEIVIPNKEFVTDRIINWSLSDQITISCPRETACTTPLTTLSRRRASRLHSRRGTSRSIHSRRTTRRRPRCKI
jgi:hypothetical protein